MAKAKFATSVFVNQLTFRRLQHLLTGQNLIGRDLRRILTETSQEGEVKVFGRAPLGFTHTLAMSVDSAVDPAHVPTWAKVTADAQRGEARYGWILQAGKRRAGKPVTYTHRHGSRTGRPTLRWFTGALPHMKKQLKKRMAAMARRIEGRWAGRAA